MMEYAIQPDGWLQIEKEGQVVALTPDEVEILGGALTYWRYLNANRAFGPVTGGNGGTDG